MPPSCVRGRELTAAVNGSLLLICWSVGEIGVAVITISCSLVARRDTSSNGAAVAAGAGPLTATDDAVAKLAWKKLHVIYD